MEKEEILKNIFGYDTFKHGQEHIVDGILNGQDVVTIMPTGAGKSICFQVPALMQKGITLVISPLISLMQNQVHALLQVGVKVAYINSSLSDLQINKVIENAKNNEYKIIYVAPERLLTSSFLEFTKYVDIDMVTIDEAHCISQWGQDFRPSYSKIPEFINSLNRRPIISVFTATATEKVKEDIINLLRLKNPLVLVSGFDRENLYFEIKRTSKKIDTLLEFLKERENQSGIIYCLTRKGVEQVYDKLSEINYSVTKYHGGISQNQRHENQELFLYDTKKIMVATNAFGMGIDKSNVNYVVHYNMPKDVESYYQEAGRGGRDGSEAHCFMIYSRQDVITCRNLIQHSYKAEDLMEEEYKRLRQMTDYVNITECLRNYILKYFGENPTKPCGKCSNCNSKFEIKDITIEAQKIVSCVYRVKEKIGKRLLIAILKGSRSQKIKNFGYENLSTYNISDLKTSELMEILDYLIISGYLKVTDEKMPIVKLTEKSKEIVKDKITLEIKTPKEKYSRKTSYSDIEIINKDLYGKLVDIRSNFAYDEKVPAFCIFSNFSLMDMCEKLPVSLDEFKKISGVGQAKLDKYGDVFIKEISSYCNGNEVVKKLDNNQLISNAVPLPTKESLKEILVTDEAVSVSVVSKNINLVLSNYNLGVVSSVSINNWLVDIGFLKLVDGAKIPTKFGSNKGIIQEYRTSNRGDYYVNLYNSELQQFIIENLTEILKRIAT